MGAVGAMAPTNFERVTFGTHEISQFLHTKMCIGTHGIFESIHIGTHVLKFQTHPLFEYFQITGFTLVKNENSSSLNVARMKLGSVGLGNVCR